MRCPFCGYIESRVIDKRETTDLSSTRRRRECLSCHKRFSTNERVEVNDLMVIKKDERREAFNPEKLKGGLFKAFEKRPFNSELITATALEIEQDIRRRFASEVPAKVLGEAVMKRLKKIDQVAYIRFASVYRNFTEVKDFEVALKELITTKKKR